MRGVLAATSAEDEWKDMDWWKDFPLSEHEIALVLGAAGVIALLVILWAIFIRKPQPKDSGRYIYPSGRGGQLRGSDSSVPGEKRRRRRRRRRRAKPTLAEAGGLPPIRSEAFPEDPP